MPIRPAIARDTSLLWSILLEAYNWNGEQRFTAEQLVTDPYAARYLADWPREGDFGVVAETDTGEPIGAAWARYLPEDRPGYGFVAPDVPELTLGVLPGHRGRGHGRALMEALIRTAAGRPTPVARLSLSVEDGNPAVRLYASLGFTRVGRNGDSDTMVLNTDPHPRVFDAHLHIVDPRFPLVENDGYLPPAFTVEQYRARVAGLPVRGGAVVSGSFQGFDQGYLREALAALGPAYVGVTQVPATVTDEEILALDTAGVRAVRFNVRRGGSATLGQLDRLARRVHDIAGWHTELYIDARDLPDLSATLAALPAVSIDHLGLHRDGLPHLLRLVERGVKVKATGFGRVDLDPAETMTAVVRTDPTALMVGTDLPSTRARRPFADEDFALIARTVGEEHLAAVLWGNAAAFYRIGKGGTHAFPL
ncbi:GNAT family N-acetyltransferase [Streptomyces sp. NPDC059352]|uniref:GNAT family N-acetyltransferase n=1 Tax=Streptomyces sp. NPDC059352 TaxID=3346810 RepID=UPI00367C709D